MILCLTVGKKRGNWMRTKPEDGNLDNLSAEKFISLLGDLNCDNATVIGEVLLEYIVKNKRKDLYQFITIENLISMAYAPLIRDTGNLSGVEFLSRDRRQM